MFSGDLSESSLPGGFLFVAYAVSLMFLTHNSTTLPPVTLSFRWTSKCRRNIRLVRKKKSLFFKYVSTAKTRSYADHCPIATEMLWVSLEGRSKTNSPRQQFQSYLFFQKSVNFAGHCTTLNRQFYLKFILSNAHQCTDTLGLSSW
jgi:hypothetical protein